MARMVDEKKERATIRAVSRDEEGRKRVEKVEIPTKNMDKIKYVEKKLMDKGVQRMERHPVDGLRGGIGRAPPKSGHGGKYTWEGPDDILENEMNDVPAAVDERDPNYDDDDNGGKGVEEEERVVGAVDVAKAAAEGRDGVARVEIDPSLTTG